MIIVTIIIIFNNLIGEFAQVIVSSFTCNSTIMRKGL